MAAFLIAPLVLAAILTFSGSTVPSGAVGALLAAVALFGGLLFNLLVVIFELSGGQAPAKTSPARWTTFLAEVNANISFTVVMTLIMAVDLIALQLVIDKDTVLVDGLSFLFWYCSGTFLLTLLMVLKRLNVVFTAQLQPGAEAAEPKQVRLSS